MHTCQCHLCLADTFPHLQRGVPGAPEPRSARPMLPVCDSIFLPGDERDSIASVDKSGVAKPTVYISSALDSQLDNLSGGNDSAKYPYPSSASGDLAFQPLESAVLLDSRDLHNSSFWDSLLPLDAMPPDYYMQFYSPVDHYAPQQNT